MAQDSQAPWAKPSSYGANSTASSREENSRDKYLVPGIIVVLILSVTFLFPSSKPIPITSSISLPGSAQNTTTVNSSAINYNVTTVSLSTSTIPGYNGSLNTTGSRNISYISQAAAEGILGFSGFYNTAYTTNQSEAI